MSKFNSGSLLLLFVLIFFSSCTHKVKDQVNSPLQQDSICDPNLVYYVNDIQPILNSNCAYSGCHDVVTHKEGVDLSSYNQVMSTAGVSAGNPSASELYKKISEGEMPPNNPLASAQQKKIYDWIKQGAKNNECTGSCDSVNVTYSQTIKPILDSYCLGCHSGNSPAAGISISDYSTTRVIAANGKLMGTIEHKAGYSAMPKNASKLSVCNIKQLKKWINDGIQNN